jgi:hypothetical protein
MSERPEKDEDQNGVIPKIDKEQSMDHTAQANHNDKMDTEENTEPKSSEGQDVVNRDPTSEAPVHQVVSGEAYSVLTPTQKKMVIVTASVASLFSPMATAIYCWLSFNVVEEKALTLISPDPSLTTIAKDLKVTDSQINITVTLFLVCHLFLQRTAACRFLARSFKVSHRRSLRTCLTRQAGDRSTCSAT